MCTLSQMKNEANIVIGYFFPKCCACTQKKLKNSALKMKRNKIKCICCVYIRSTMSIRYLLASIILSSGNMYIIWFGVCCVLLYIISLCIHN